MNERIPCRTGFKFYLFPPNALGCCNPRYMTDWSLCDSYFTIASVAQLDPCHGEGKRRSFELLRDFHGSPSSCPEDITINQPIVILYQCYKQHCTAAESTTQLRPGLLSKKKKNSRRYNSLGPHPTR